jgi:hypothetical protein
MITAALKGAKNGFRYNEMSCGRQGLVGWWELMWLMSVTLFVQIAII